MWSLDRSPGMLRAVIVLALVVSLELAGSVHSGPASADGGRWIAKASMPTARWYVGTAHLNGVIYAVGGSERYDCTFSNALEAYDIATDTWSVRRPMPTRRIAPGVGVVGGIVYAFGGGVGCGAYTSVLEAFDPAAGTWTARASMSVVRYQAGAAVIDGILYAVGGNVRASCADPNTMEAYDPVADAWTFKGPIPAPGCHTYSKAVAVGAILYTAGLDPSAAGTSIALRAYDPSTDSWTARSSSPVSWTGGDFSGLGAVHGLIYVVDAGVVQIYDPATDTWTAGTPTPTLASGRSAVGAGGTLYAVGGLGCCPTVLSETWAFTPPLPTAISECKSGAWRAFGVFKNQGDCVSFVATGGRNPPR